MEGSAILNHEPERKGEVHDGAAPVFLNEPLGKENNKMREIKFIDTTHGLPSLRRFIPHPDGRMNHLLLSAAKLQLLLLTK